MIRIISGWRKESWARPNNKRPAEVYIWASESYWPGEGINKEETPVIRIQHFNDGGVQIEEGTLDYTASRFTPYRVVYNEFIPIFVNIPWLRKKDPYILSDIKGE